MGFMWLPYLASHYVWVIVAGLLLICTIEFPTSKTTKIFESKQNSIYNRSAVPQWFVHASDLHIAEEISKSYGIAKDRLSKARDLLKPEKFVFTGDLTDSLLDGEYTKQNIKDWMLYDKFLKDMDIDPIQVAGNHDYFSLVNTTSKATAVDPIVFTEGTRITNRIPYGDYEFVTINPFQIPAPSLGMTWYMMSGSEEVEKIEAELRKTEKKGSLIVIGHHPTQMWFDEFGSILESAPAVRLYLCGHLHPTEPKIMHHGDVVEIVGTALKKRNEIGLVVIDNDEFSYHQIDLSLNKTAVLTHPIPDHQTSSHVAFSSIKEFSALAFGEDLNLGVKGDFEGTFDCSQKLQDGVYKCLLDVASMTPGTHTIELVGDWNGTVTFTVGDTVGPLKEKGYINEPVRSWVVLMIIAVCICGVLGCFWDFGVDMTSDWDAWLVGTGEANWLLTLLGGIGIVHHHICKSHIVIRIVFFIGVLWSIFPLSIFTVDDRNGILWVWGWSVSGNCQWHYKGAQALLYYLAGVYIPCSIAISATKVLEITRFTNRMFFVDLVFYILASAFGWYKCIDFSTYHFARVSSFVHLMLPVFLHLTVIANFAVAVKNACVLRNNPAYREFTDKLTGSGRVVVV